MSRTRIISFIGRNMDISKDEIGRLNICLVTPDGHQSTAVFDGMGIEHLRLFLDQNFPAVPMPQAPTSQKAAKLVEPNLAEHPGTMCFTLAEGGAIRVCLGQHAQSVSFAVKVNSEWEFLYLTEAEATALSLQLNHCKHHLRTQVRVKEVPAPAGAPGLATVALYHVVMDMQGEPMAVFHTSKDLERYLQANKLTTVEK